jgi:hypothetical protein
MRPDDRETATRDQHPGDLCDREPGLEPVKRLSDEHAFDAVVGEWDCFCPSSTHISALDQAPHVVVGLDGHDRPEAASKLPGQPARSGAEIEDARSGVEIEDDLRAVEQRSEVRRPNAVVDLGDVAEGEAERARFVQRPASASGPRNGYR